MTDVRSDGSWVPSARQVERDASAAGCGCARRPIATLATVVVLGLLVVGVLTSPGWPRVRETFFSWDDAKASFPAVIKGFGRTCCSS